MASALRLSVRDTDLVARLGGDEFGVILVGCAGEASALRFEETLRQRLADRLDALPVPVGFTVGQASLRSTDSPAAVLHEADMAMLARKQTRL